jgi:hypothetical protein
MPEIYDLAAKSQCANQIWSNGVLEQWSSGVMDAIITPSPITPPLLADNEPLKNGNQATAY